MAKQFKKKIQKPGLKREDAHDRTKCREGVQMIAMRNILSPPLTWTKQD